MRKLLGLLAGTLLSLPLLANDTLQLSLPQVEERFLRKNFVLLASQYNLPIGQALQKQALLWNNPSISLEQNIYNQYTHKAFDMGSTGQNAVQIQQLILLAGKRNKRWQIEKLNTEISEYQFFDLMRTLRLELVSNFYSLVFTSQKRISLERQIQPLRLLTKAYEEQLAKGNVAFKEVARLKALQFKLEADRLTLLNDELAFNAVLKNMMAMQGDTFVQPVYSETKATWLTQKNFADLRADAQTHRYDLLAAQKNVELQLANVKLQKAMAVPDLNLGLSYDRAGSYIQNYYAVTLGMYLPVYNRNQQMVKVAQLQSEQSKTYSQGLVASLDNELQQHYRKAVQLDEAYKGLSGQLFGQMDQLQQAIMLNYQKKNITLIEFVDFFESYQENISNYLDLKSARETAFEELFYTLGHKLNDE